MENIAMELNKVPHIHLKYPTPEISCLFVLYFLLFFLNMIDIIKYGSECNSNEDRTQAGGKNVNLRSVNRICRRM